MIDRSDITGAVLCGGDARRMDGVDKPLQLLAGTSMVAHVCARLAPQVARVVISANRSVSAYAAVADAVADAVVADGTPGMGPLGGVVAVLGCTTTSWAFVCPGDAPLLPETVVASLVQAVTDEVDVVVPHDGVQLQPLFMLMRTSLRGGLAAYLEAGHRSVHGWLETQRVAVVPMADQTLQFLNINTWDALTAASHVLPIPLECS